MAVTNFSPLLGLALPTTGDLSGTWGSTVNDAITSLLDSAVAGTTSLTTDADVTLSTTNGAANQARNAVILWNPASGTTTRNITAPAQSKIYTVINASGGTQSIVFRGAGPTTGVTIIKGESAQVAWSGSDFVKIGSSAGDVTVRNLTVTGNTILGDAVGDTVTINGTATFSNANPTLTAGTANGVAYLNGSKVLTTGSALTFDGTNLGIGTSSPRTQLDIRNVSGTTGFLVSRGASSASPSLGINTDSTTAYVESYGPMAFKTAALSGSLTEQMRIDSSGNVSTNVGGYWQLQPSATAAAPTYSFNGDTDTGMFRPAGVANTVAFSTTGSERLRIDSSGNVGIGTSSPAEKLSLTGNFRVDTGYIYFAGNTSTPAVGAGIYRPATDTLGFVINSSERMRIDSSGNFGIGTSSPSQKLEVAGNMYINTSGNPYLQIKTSGAGNNPYIRMQADTNYWDIQSTFSNTNDDLLFQYNGTALLDLDKNGNLGLGVTPSAWTRKAIQLGDASAAYVANNSGGATVIATNMYFDGSNKYATTAAAARYSVGTGTHEWYTAPSGTAGNAISFTQAMTLDASSNLMVGGTSALQSAKITAYGSVSAQNGGVDGTFANAFVGVYSGNSNEHNVIQTAVSSGGGGSGFRFKASDGGGSSATTTVLDLTRTQTVFYTGGSERARIDSSGNLLVGTTSNGSNSRLVVASTVNTQSEVLSLAASSGNVFGKQIVITQNISDTTSRYLTCETNNGNTAKLYIYSNGNVVNANNSYGSLSDSKLKENIVDATPKLAGLMQVKVRNYNLIGDTQKQIGVIAQELEQVFPGVVDVSPDIDSEGNDLGTTTKSVKYSVFVPMLIKAIQEQQAIIESLKARLDAANL